MKALAQRKRHCGPVDSAAKKTPLRAEESGAGAAASDARRGRGRQGNPPAAPGRQHARTGGGCATVRQQNASESSTAATVRVTVQMNMDCGVARR